MKACALGFTEVRSAQATSPPTASIPPAGKPYVQPVTVQGEGGKN